MGFEKLQQRLREFFITETSCSSDGGQRARVRELTLTAFSRQKSSPSFLNFWKAPWIRSATIGAIVISLFPIFGGERAAGELSPNGLVEIVRDGRVFVATGKTPLHVGDQILVGNNASAEIQLRKSLHTVAGEHAEVRISRKNSLFLEKGSLDGNISDGFIETDRGKINTEKNAALNIFVSESGETHIQPRKNDIWVTTWNQNKTILAAGEELRLQTDTQLPPEIPRDLRLSSSQLLAIQAKLLIARTKALNSIEARLLQDSEKAVAELNSAERTFRSIAQVLKSSRNLQVLRRENLALISRDTVIQRLTARTERGNLLENAYAIDSLLTIVDSERTPKFLTIDSGLLIFNRYALLQRLFAPLPESFRAHGKMLQQQYVEALARQITNSDSPEKEIISAVAMVPKSGSARQFFQQVQRQLLPPQKEQLRARLEMW